MKARRYRLLRLERRPEPSIFTQYWSLPSASTTTPDRSHFLGALPVWFWTKTLSPMSSLRRPCAWLFNFSEVLVKRVRNASSFAVQASRHSGRMLGFVNLSNLLMNPKASRSGRPNTTWAGDRSQSGSGVFLSWSIARRKRSLSSDPSGLTLDIRRRLVDLTATSALPLDWG